jgi:hypothetical protein
MDKPQTNFEKGYEIARQIQDDRYGTATGKLFFKFFQDIAGFKQHYTEQDIMPNMRALHGVRKAIEDGLTTLTHKSVDEVARYYRLKVQRG